MTWQLHILVVTGIAVWTVVFLMIAMRVVAVLRNIPAATMFTARVCKADTAWRKQWFLQRHFDVALFWLRCCVRPRLDGVFTDGGPVYWPGRERQPEYSE